MVLPRRRIVFQYGKRASVKQLIINTMLSTLKRNLLVDKQISVIRNQNVAFRPVHVMSGREAKPSPGNDASSRTQTDDNLKNYIKNKRMATTL